MEGQNAELPDLTVVWQMPQGFALGWPGEAAFLGAVRFGFPGLSRAKHKVHPQSALREYPKRPLAAFAGGLPGGLPGGLCEGRLFHQTEFSGVRSQKSKSGASLVEPELLTTPKARSEPVSR